MAWGGIIISNKITKAMHLPTVKGSLVLFQQRLHGQLQHRSIVVPPPARRENTTPLATGVSIEEIVAAVMNAQQQRANPTPPAPPQVEPTPAAGNTLV